MPLEDAQRWNDRYAQQTRETFEQVRPFLEEHSHLLPPTGLALDVAMGLGGNARFLLDRGLRVMGVDISEVAVRQAKEKSPALMAFVADLAGFELPRSRFNLITNFFYLQRELWYQFPGALLPGGLLVVQTLTQEMRQRNPEIDPAYLLHPGELRQLFTGMDVLVYREGWETGHSGHARAVASLVARTG